MYRRELEARKVASYEVTDGISIHLLIIVKLHKHPNLIKKTQNELSKEEKHELRYFSPVFLTSEDWDDKNLDCTLMQLS